jgi:CBS-domain-containing membrane protein
MSDTVVTISADASIRDFVGLLREHGVSGVPVVDEVDTVVGTASVTDLLWLSDLIVPDAADRDARLRARELDEGAVRDIMTPDVFGVEPTASLTDLGRFFTRTGLHRALVLDKGRLVGIVSVTDLVGLIAR